MQGQDRKNCRRIPARRLLACAFIGGFPGALAGRVVFRHKTQRVGFSIALWAAATLHLAMWATIVALSSSGRA